MSIKRQLGSCRDCRDYQSWLPTGVALVAISLTIRNSTWRKISLCRSFKDYNSDWWKISFYFNLYCNKVNNTKFCTCWTTLLLGHVKNFVVIWLQKVNHLFPTSHFSLKCKNCQMYQFSHTQLWWNWSYSFDDIKLFLSLLMHIQWTSLIRPPVTVVAIKESWSLMRGEINMICENHAKNVSKFVNFYSDWLGLDRFTISDTCLIRGSLWVRAQPVRDDVTL